MTVPWQSHAMVLVEETLFHHPHLLDISVPSNIFCNHCLFSFITLVHCYSTKLWRLVFRLVTEQDQLRKQTRKLGSSHCDRRVNSWNASFYYVKRRWGIYLATMFNILIFFQGLLVRSDSKRARIVKPPHMRSGGLFDRMRIRQVDKTVWSALVSQPATTAKVLTASYIDISFVGAKRPHQQRIN